MCRLLLDRDRALEANSTFSGMPQSFIDWTWQTWLPSHLHRYERQVQEHLSHLNFKIAELNGDLERAGGGILDSRDEAVDLRDRLQIALDARQLAS